MQNLSYINFVTKKFSQKCNRLKFLNQITFRLSLNRLFRLSN